VHYDFDKEIIRVNTQSSKWDNVGVRVGNASALPMWVADTDFCCPKPVVDAVKSRAEHYIYGYPYITPDFAKATVDWIKKRYGWSIKDEWVVFSCGVVPVLNAMIQAFTEPGDKVIIQRPVYHPFGYAIIDNDRTISNNRLVYENNKYSIDFDDLERLARCPKTKLMILCNPHNPVGRVFTEEELTRIAEICLKNQIILISDEIHSDLVFPGYKHIPVASLKQKYAMNTVTCYSPSKAFNIAGLRASGIIIPNPIIRERLEHQFKKNRSVQQNVFAVPAYVAAYSKCDDYLEQLIVYLKENVDFLRDYLKKKMPKIKLVEPEATYLMWLDCTELGMSGDELASFIINDCNVAINRGDSFGEEGSNHIRLNIGCPKKTLKKGLDQIYEQYKKRF